MRNPKFDFTSLKKTWLEQKERSRNCKFSVTQMQEMYLSWDTYIEDMFRQQKWTHIIDTRIVSEEVTEALIMIHDFYSFVRRAN